MLKKILKSKLLRVIVILAVVLSISVFFISGIRSKTDANELQFVEDAIRRSAIQAYVLEGSFPSTEQGVQHLVDNYGLILDSSRFVIYYESMGGNILPQIKVISTTDQ